MKKGKQDTKTGKKSGKKRGKAARANNRPAAGNWKKRDPEFKAETGKYDQPIPSRTFLKQLLDESEGPISVRALVRNLEIDDPVQIDAVQRRLQAMTRSGEVIRTRRGEFGIPERMDLLKGRVIGHRDGYGFFRPDEGGDDVYLHARQMKEVMHGDHVVVRVVGEDNRGRPEGSIVEILERGRQQVVGQYFREKGVGFVVPDNPRLTQDIAVPDDDRNGARHEEVVVVELTSFPTKRSLGVGRVVERLGERRAPGLEIEIALRSHVVPHEWPEDVLEQADAFGSEIPSDAIEERKDLRDLPLVTIDGEDAKDFDDAVYARATESGWKLWVAIADVSHYVSPGSALDVEAQNRGNSVYFPGQVVPMLPEVLSNGLCSLNPDVDRLCMVCEMRVSPSGEVTGAKFHRAVMRSKARLTYTLVAEALENPDNAQPLVRPHLEALQTLQQVFQSLLRARDARGALDMDSSETRIVFNPDRKIDRIVPVERNVAHRIIEECMIAANVQAARFVARKKLPLLYRVHDKPDADRVRELREFLSTLGLKLGGGAKPRPKDYAKLLDAVRQRADRRLVQTVLLRSLMQAQYSPRNEGHFGLALDDYAHFTSPIRRYPDLLLHRAIGHALERGKPREFRYSFADMERLGAHCSLTERRADDATRDVESWLKCEFMESRIGESYGALVTGVTGFGLFVEVDDVRVEGLVHVTSLGNDYYHHEPALHQLVGERSGRVYRLGDRLTVKVVRADPAERKIDFELVSDDKRDDPSRQRKSPKKNRNRRKK